MQEPPCPVPHSRLHDGNQVVNTVGNTDWAALNAAQKATLTTGADLQSGQTDNTFGNGTKTSTPTSTVGLGPDPEQQGRPRQLLHHVGVHGQRRTFLYLGVTRVTTSGTVNLDIEVNQNGRSLT